MTLTELHALLQRAFDELAKVRGNAPEGIGTDSALAVGYALGTISKAKALVGRDITGAPSRLTFDAMSAGQSRGQSDG